MQFLHQIKRLRKLITIVIAFSIFFSACYVVATIQAFASCILPVNIQAEAGEKTDLSAQVESFRGLVIILCKKYEMDDYADLILAMIQQESGGNGIDVMQCAESGLAEITSQEISIDTGIRYFKSLLQSAGVSSINDTDKIKLALQSYNFGGGFIDYASQRGGYNMNNVYSFQEMMKNRLGWSNYGDAQYVPHVWRYYDVTVSFENNNPGKYDPNSIYYGLGVNIFTDAGYAGQCTWYVWGRVNEVNDGKYTGYALPTGNASSWFATARAKGFDVGSTPRANSIVVYNDASGYGHVAYIESINGENICFSDGNTGNSEGDGVYFYNHNYTNRLDVCFQYVKVHNVTLSEFYNYPGGSYYIIGFIYL